MSTKSDSSGSGSVTPTLRGRSDTRQDTQEIVGSTSRSRSRDHVKAVAKEAEARLNKTKEEERRKDIAEVVKSISILSKSDTNALSMIGYAEELKNIPVVHDDFMRDWKEEDSYSFSVIQKAKDTGKIEQIKQVIETHIDDVLHQIKQVVSSQSDDTGYIEEELIKMREDNPYLYKMFLDRLSEERYSTDVSFEPVKRLVESANSKYEKAGEELVDTLIDTINKAPASDYAREKLTKIKQDDPYTYIKFCDRLKEKDASFDLTKRLIKSINSMDERIAVLMTTNDDLLAILKKKRLPNAEQQVLKNVLLSEINIFIDKINEAVAPWSGLPRFESKYAVQKLIDVKKTKPLVYESFCDRLKEKDASFEPTKKLIDRINSTQQFVERLKEERDSTYQKAIKKVDNLNIDIVNKFVALRKRIGLDAYNASRVSRYARAYTDMHLKFKKRPSPIEDPNLLEGIELRIDAIDELEIKSFEPDEKKRVRKERMSEIEKLINEALKERIDGLIPAHRRLQSEVHDYVTSLKNKTVQELMHESILEKPQQVEAVEEPQQAEAVEEPQQAEVSERRIQMEAVKETQQAETSEKPQQAEAVEGRTQMEAVEETQQAEVSEKEKAREYAKSLRDSLDIEHQKRIKPVEDLRQKIDEKFELLQKEPEIEINADTSEAVNQLFASYQKKDSAFKKNPPPIRDKKLLENIELRLKIIGEAASSNFTEEAKERLIKGTNNSIKEAIDKAGEDFEKKMDKHLAFLTDLDSKLTSLQEKASKERTQAEAVEERTNESQEANLVPQERDYAPPSPEEALKDLEDALSKFFKLRRSIYKKLDKMKIPRQEATEAAPRITEVPDTSSYAPRPPKISPAVEAQIRTKMDEMMEDINSTGFQRNRNVILLEIIKMRGQNEDAFEHFKSLVQHKLLLNDSWAPIQGLIEEVENTTTQ